MEQTPKAKEAGASVEESLPPPPPYEASAPSTAAASSSTTPAVQGANTFHPNRVFYIHPHGEHSTEMKVVDVTPHVTLSWHTPGFEDQAKSAATSQTLPICLAARRENWHSSEFDVYEGGDATTGSLLARWKAPFWSHRTTVLTFPPGSPHCSHQIEMSPPNMWSRQEHFVKDGAMYQWVRESYWHNRRTELCKTVGGILRPVAKLFVPFRVIHIKCGAVVAMDDRETDWAVVLLSALVVLKKLRHRELEGGE